MRTPHPSLSAPILAIILACGGGRPGASADAAADSVGPVAALRVNPGQHGMTGVVRWLRSPDGSSLLTVEDWSSTENEPFPDGFLLASESTGRMVRADSVWDVAPAPDWSRVAFGRATRMMAGESERVPEDSLVSAARQLGVTLEAARAAQFPASAMAAAAGFAQLGVADATASMPRILPVLAGWRVRWSGDGTRIFAGRGPALADDDAPATAWVTVDAATGSVIGAADSASAEPAWVTGPTLDISVVPDTGRVELVVEGGIVESAGGTIRLRGREIGAGFALTATRRGCYIAALLYDVEAGEHAPKHRVVVYDTGCPRPPDAT